MLRSQRYTPCSRSYFPATIAARSRALWAVRLVDLGQNPGVMHLVHLVFHEAGHAIAAMLTDNRTLIVFMGSGNQVLVPLIVTLAFYFKNHDAFGAAVG